MKETNLTVEERAERAMKRWIGSQASFLVDDIAREIRDAEGEALERAATLLDEAEKRKWESFGKGQIDAACLPDLAQSIRALKREG